MENPSVSDPVLANSTIPVTARIRARLPTLQPAMRRVGEFITRSPARAARLTISALAREVDTSETTVIRFCKELGLRGYAELRLALATELGGRTSADVLFEEERDISAGDDVSTAIERIAHSDFRSVSDTIKALPLAELTLLAKKISVAPRIETYGVGASGMAALDLQQKLHRIGKTCFAYTDPHFSYSSSSLLQREDVAIAFSNSGVTMETVLWLRLAQEAGATTIAVTNTPGSDITRHADHVLHTVALETDFRAGATGSRLAQLTFVDCIFIGVAQESFEESIAALELTRASVDRLRKMRGVR